MNITSAALTVALASNATFLIAYLTRLLFLYKVYATRQNGGHLTVAGRVTDLRAPRSARRSPGP